MNEDEAADLRYRRMTAGQWGIGYRKCANPLCGMRFGQRHGKQKYCCPDCANVARKMRLK